MAQVTVTVLPSSSTFSMLSCHALPPTDADGAPRSMRCRAATIEVDPARHLADAGHRWQLEPFHYDDAYNDGAIGRLRDLVRAAEAA